ncbi:uncharacterized protein LOC114882997 [Osmia bicornis bicornis]|uniref:uncharacterized protein LOC114882997 n=1 Tax=Osmia bicornis bicornis TaxID=1437191 RepID=UPI0010F82079|nr:uncharacterized protein LOC114882997 [Osmia bicornis bicornis]XP_029056110.1 uncharacterized protein LOC114882997 [Osmia bicornis bicornis]XP_029056111.1 uncharacterized protein LOC114882997 [Osmia bicornis bicornis]XP_046145793.1 uncharacterized protein LOC114882997 [Osmia bicornis bicornis]XP_046145800.1 uncharacterized protein LOC114882997 [Osmia bicornis bicornis]
MRNNKMPQRVKSASNENKVKIEEEASTSFPLAENSGEDDPNVAEVVLSNKGGPKLIHRGFMYTLHKKQPYNIRWRCVGRTMHCRGSLITTTSCTKPRVRMEHNHKPDFAAAQVARKRYLALGKPCVLTNLEGNQNSMNAPQRMIHKENDVPKEQEGRRRTTRTTARKVLQSPSQSNTTGKTIRIAAQSLVRPHLRNIAPAPIQQQQQQQQQQRQPKTLVLKTIPLKVKQVAPTTIKMPPRQTTQGLPHNIVHQQPTEVCLRWNSYHSNMQNSFPSLLDSEQFVDVTLACEGRSLKCHKMILSSCSDYLADLLRENPCQHPIILMKDLKFWEVEALVKFMYRGEVNVAHDKLPQLLNAAEALQVKGLAGPNPSSQNPKPPLLIPQSKPVSQPVPRASSETKEKASTSGVTTPSSPKRAQKRQHTEPTEPKPFTKIRLQRPVTPTSPGVTVKMEPLDIPLSPTEIFPETTEDCSTPSNFDKLMSLHEEDDPGGNEVTDGEREINFCEIPEPPDINDSEDQMEFVPTDFLDQEQDIVEETETASNKDNKEESRDYSSVELEDGERSENEKEPCSKEKKPV